MRKAKEKRMTCLPKMLAAFPETLRTPPFGDSFVDKRMGLLLSDHKVGLVLGQTEQL